MENYKIIKKVIHRPDYSCMHVFLTKETDDQYDVFMKDHTKTSVAWIGYNERIRELITAAGFDADLVIKNLSSEFRKDYAPAIEYMDSIASHDMVKDLIGLIENFIALHVMANDYKKALD